MRHVSFDPAKKTGVAVWDSGKLVQVASMRPATLAECKRHGEPPGAWAYLVRLASGEQAKPLVLGRHDSFRRLIRDSGVDGVACEESKGKSPRTVSQLGEIRGYLQAIADGERVRYVQVSTDEWQRVAMETFGGGSFPKNRDLAKGLAIKLVRERFGWPCNDDEADAVLVGLWAFRTRTWSLEPERLAELSSGAGGAS